MNSLAIPDVVKGFFEKDFYVVAQPKISLKEEKLVGYEILSRLKIDGKNIPPDFFINKLKSRGHLKLLTIEVVKEALSIIKILKITTDRDFKVSINLTPEELEDSGHIENIINLVSGSNKNLIIEITEGSRIGGRHTDSLKRLHEENIDLSLDDFWTGYSCMQSLQTGYFCEIKIDHSITSNIVNDHVSMAGLQAITDMAKNLGLRCVIEGVETTLTKDIALEAGGVYGQGFLFSHGIEKDDISRWTKNWIEYENVKSKTVDISIFDRSDEDLLIARKHPSWVWDFNKKEITWGNNSAIKFWGCRNLEELKNKDYSSISEMTKNRLESYRKRYLGGVSQVSSTWTFYPGGIRKEIFCVCLPRIDRKTGNLNMLVIGLEGYSKSASKNRFHDGYEPFLIPYVIFDGTGRVIKVSDAAYVELEIDSVSIVCNIGEDYFSELLARSRYESDFYFYIEMKTGAGNKLFNAKFMVINSSQDDLGEYVMVFFSLPCMRAEITKPDCEYIEVINHLKL